MKYVIDASVAMKWIVKEKHFEEAGLYLLKQNDLFAPDLIKHEIANAIVKKVRISEIEAKNGWISYQNLFQFKILELIRMEDVIERAYILAVTIKHSFYDCIYLAAAEKIKAEVVTADQKFYRRVIEHGQYSHLIR